MQGGLELQAQDIGESAFAGFDDGTGVMGGQSAQRGVGVPGVAQVPGAVQGVQTDRRAVIVLGIGAKVLAAISLPAMNHRELDTKRRSIWRWVGPVGMASNAIPNGHSESAGGRVSVRLSAAAWLLQCGCVVITARLPPGQPQAAVRIGRFLRA